MQRFSLTVLLFSYMFCAAQKIDFTTEQSKVLREQFNNTELKKTIQDEAGGIYTLRYYAQRIPSSGPFVKGYIIQYWDKDLKPILYYNYTVQNKDAAVAGFFLNNNKLHLLEYVKNKKDKTIDCFTHISETQKLSFEKKKLFSVNINKFPGFFGSLSNRYDFDFGRNIAFSPDKKNMIFHIDSYSKKEESHVLFVYNNNLELLWTREFTHEKQDNLFDLVDVVIGNDASVYSLGKIYNEGRKAKKKGKANYHFELFKITEEKTEITSLSVADNFVNSLRLLLSKDQIACVGFYSEKNDYRSIGTVNFNVDRSSMTLLNSKFQKFSSEFMTDKYGNRSEKELSAVLIKKIESLDNGDYIIAAEEFFIQYNTHPNGTTTITYNFDDIMIIRLSRLGDLIWARNINKTQNGRDFSPILSYSMLSANENIYLFLNAYKKLGTLDDGRKRFKSGTLGNLRKGNSNFYVIRLDNQGVWDFETVLVNKEAKVIFDAAIGIPLNDSKILFYGDHDNKGQFLTFNLN